jgi:hypothetical protein
MCYNIYIKTSRGEKMKVNKTIYIELETLQEMEKFCKTIKSKDGKEVKLSKLIEMIWKDTKEKYKK